MRSLITNLVLSLRPRQWTKNLALFVALIFSRNLFNPRMVLLAVSAFGIFCCLSGGVYIFNDVIDLEKDRKHPQKSTRPIASGAFSVPQALTVFCLLILAALAGAFQINTLFALTVIGYLSLQVAYTLLLKHLVIIDIFSIAAGFFLRVLAGAYAISVTVSSWLFVCTFFISLFLALCKRRHEIVLLDYEAVDHRGVLGKYDVLLLDQMISVVTASTVVAYSVYTLSEETVRRFGTSNLKYTIPFVLFGIYRYLYLVYRKKQGGSPEAILLTDVPLVADIFLYCTVVGLVLYM